MKTNRKTAAALVFALAALFTAAAEPAVEEYIIGEKYCKKFPGAGSRWVEVSSIIKYDKQGNEIYKKSSSGDEWWYEYDERGYIIHSIFTPSEIEYYGQEYWYEYTFRPDGTRKTRILFVRKFNPSDFTFPPRPIFDYETVKTVEPKEVAVDAGGIYRVSENLRLRENEDTFSAVVTTMQAGTPVKVLL